MKKTKNKSIRTHGKVFGIISVTILGLYSFTMLFALYLAISNSLKGIVDFTLNPLGLPSRLRLDNYKNAFNQLGLDVASGAGRRTIGFFELFFNSLLYVFGCTVVGIYTHFTCAYVAAKHRNIVTKMMHWIVVFLISFPQVGSLASSMVIMKTTGVYNNRLLYFLYCGGFTGSNFLIFYAASKGIDNAFLEAAKLDGAGYYRIQFTIVMPMVKNLLLGMALLQIISLWNTWQTPMLYLPSYPTISYALYRFQFNTNNSVSQIPAQMAGCVLVMLPTLILFVIFKDKFIGNITLGGLKG